MRSRIPMIMRNDLGPVAGGWWRWADGRWPVAGGGGPVAGGWALVAGGRWLGAGGRWLVAELGTRCAGAGAEFDLTRFETHEMDIVFEMHLQHRRTFRAGQRHDVVQALQGGRGFMRHLRHGRCARCRGAT